MSGSAASNRAEETIARVFSGAFHALERAGLNRKWCAVEAARATAAETGTDPLEQMGISAMFAADVLPTEGSA